MLIYISIAGKTIDNTADMLRIKYIQAFRGEQLQKLKFWMLISYQFQKFVLKKKNNEILVNWKTNKG